MAFLDWSTTAGSNTAIGGIGIQGSNAVQNFDNAFREMMAQARAGLDGKMTLLTKSAGYTAVLNDNNALIRFTAGATLSLTAAATLGAGWHCIVQADGGAVVIDPNSSETVNGASTLLIQDGASTLVICDGTNFRALKDFQFSQPPANVASATTADIGAAASVNVVVTGTTTITSLGTSASGTFRMVTFDAALTLTYNATSLSLPGNANILTAAGDTAAFISLGSGNWRCMYYTRRNGSPLAIVGTVSQSGGVPTGAIVERGSNANGEYVKFADGTMICTNPSLVMGSTTTATGSGFQSSTATTWTFPVAFSSAPKVTANGAYTSGPARAWVSIDPPTTTSVGLVSHSFVSASIVGANAIAVGRWF